MIDRQVVVSTNCESSDRGGIHNLAEYLRAKIIDHRGWGRVLPRSITPMDFDMMLDNNGSQIYVELCRYSADWNDIPNGQHIAYRKAVNVGKGMHVAVLARHETPSHRPIDSYVDVVEFSVMYYDKGAPACINEDIMYRHYVGNAAWVDFVKQWFK